MFPEQVRTPLGLWTSPFLNGGLRLAKQRGFIFFFIGSTYRFLTRNQRVSTIFIQRECRLLDFEL